jgi:hypothetical protein
LLVFDPSRARPLYAIDEFSVVPYIACKVVIEVKSSLNTKTFKQLLAVWHGVAGLGIPTFGFAYRSVSFPTLLQLLAGAVKHSGNPEYRLERLPECLCVHKGNLLAFRRRASQDHAPEYYMVLNFGHVGEEAKGAATGGFFSQYLRSLRKDLGTDDFDESNRPWLFNEVPLSQEAKAWIDRSGNINSGNLSTKPASP